MKISIITIIASIAIVSKATAAVISEDNRHSNDNGIVIPLARRNVKMYTINEKGDRVVNPEAVRTALNIANAKYSRSGSGKDSPSVAKNRRIKGLQRRKAKAAASSAAAGSGTVVPLTDDVQKGADIEYNVAATVSAGKTSSLFTFDVDTGSSDLWVPTTTCKGQAGCANKNLFPAADAKTASNGTPFKVQYGTGSVSGVTGTADFAMGAIKIKNQTLGFCDTLSDDFGTTKADALVGFAFDSLANDKAPTPMSNAIKQGLVKDNSFTLSLNRDAQGNAKGGDLILGGTGSFDKNAMVFTPVVADKGSSPSFWKTTMDSANVNGKAAVTKINAIIDSGTTLILAPQGDADAIFAKVKGAQPISKLPGVGPKTREPIISHFLGLRSALQDAR